MEILRRAMNGKQISIPSEGNLWYFDISLHSSPMHMYAYMYSYEVEEAYYDIIPPRQRNKLSISRLSILVLWVWILYPVNHEESPFDRGNIICHLTE